MMKIMIFIVLLKEACRHFQPQLWCYNQVFFFKRAVDSSGQNYVVEVKCFLKDMWGRFQ